MPPARRRPLSFECCRPNAGFELSVNLKREHRRFPLFFAIGSAGNSFSDQPLAGKDREKPEL
jgi:hypothetical protein